jgi:hypothetical protein
MREGTFARDPWKRSTPILFDGSSGILARFGSLTEIAQHRIDRPLKLQITLANTFLHVLPFSIRPQPLELFMRVEDKDRPGKSACLARAVGVHSDHIKRPAAKAEGKVRVGRIRGDVLVPGEPAGIPLVEKAQLFPDQVFEFNLSGRTRVLEDGNEGRVLMLGRGPSEVVEFSRQRFRRFFVGQVREDPQSLRIGVESGFRTETGEFRTQNELTECLFGGGEGLTPVHWRIYAEYALPGPPGRT